MRPADRERLRAATYRRSMRASTAAVAAELQGVVGQRLVAYVTGRSSNRTVARWAVGMSTPPLVVEGKLRALYRAVLTLEPESAEAVRAWLTSANPDLDDAVPAEVLRDGDPVRVFHAAEAFIGGGS